MASPRAPSARHRLAIVLVGAGLVALFAFFAWAFWASGGLSWTGGSIGIIGPLVVGAVAVGALTGVLMWLAFYSARKGFDEPPELEPPHREK